MRVVEGGMGSLECGRGDGRGGDGGCGCRLVIVGIGKEVLCCTAIRVHDLVTSHSSLSWARWRNAA